MFQLSKTLSSLTFQTESPGSRMYHRIEQILRNSPLQQFLPLTDLGTLNFVKSQSPASQARTKIPSQPPWVPLLLQDPLAVFLHFQFHESPSNYQSSDWIGGPHNSPSRLCQRIHSTLRKQDRGSIQQRRRRKRYFPARIRLRSLCSRHSRRW